MRAHSIGGLGRFPFSQNCRSNRLKCKWNARLKSREIFRNKRTTFRGNPLFPFQPVGTEIIVPFVQNFHFYCSRIFSPLHQLLAPSRSINEIASFLPAWRKPFLLSRKISGISNEMESLMFLYVVVDMI